MADERVVIGRGERREAEQARVIAEPREQVGFRERLIGWAADAAYPRQRNRRASRPRGSSPRRPSESTGSNNPTRGSRMANCVVCTPTPRPPEPAAM
jgi:hypothetical protein